MMDKNDVIDNGLGKYVGDQKHCDCQAPPTDGCGHAMVSIGCPFHGDGSYIGPTDWRSKPLELIECMSNNGWFALLGETIDGFYCIFAPKENADDCSLSSIRYHGCLADAVVESAYNIFKDT